ncbi:MAG: hypothetical protein B7Z66_14690 [Chromatiales bacterium 21-64-14]|nr:MAG: hypothetical protein B7Z66_14690 [Chromatiales bacterium 21-64-14]HQU17138.1 Rrf2 family transcriptional regulator [Gammaproteobacteria bacterium]
MRLSTKGRHAVTAMLDLAVRQEDGPVTLAEIARIQGISLSYLEQLFARLRRIGLVEGVRGPGGGYRLAQPLHAITFAQIIAAVDENATADGEPACSAEDPGAVPQALWATLSQEIYGFLDGISLEAFLQRPDVRQRVTDRQSGRSAA